MCIDLEIELVSSMFLFMGILSIGLSIAVVLMFIIGLFNEKFSSKTACHLIGHLEPVPGETTCPRCGKEVRLDVTGNYS